MRTRLTRSQKRKHLATGLVLSLVSAGIIGGALALATKLLYLPSLVAIAVFLFCNILYFSEPA